MNNEIGLFKNQKEQILAYIHKKLLQPITHRVLQNFPPDRGFKQNKIDIAKWLSECAHDGRELHMYIAIPFCTHKGVDKKRPEKCGFCLLPTVPFSKKIFKQYFDVLINKELPLYAKYLGRNISMHPVDSIFLGGGTPNIMTMDLYTRLLDAIRKHFMVKQDAEITTEGTPELYSYEKISHFRELGGTRISFGVQQFNEDLLPLSGRKVSKDHTQKMISHAIKTGLSVSIDLG